MPRTKNSTQKSNEEVDEIEDVVIGKVNTKKNFDIEAIIDPVPLEKMDEVEVATETEEDEDSTEDSLGLDDEEINPFKDKWEE